MMQISPPEDTPNNLLDKLIESRSYQKNPVPWSVFYGSSIITIVMFFILCALASWSISIGTQITGLVTQATDILNDVEEMLPVLKSICKHQNFTKNYAGVCDTII